MASLIGKGRSGRIVESALKTAIGLSMSTSRLLGVKPNYFLVEVPRKMVERSGSQGTSDAFLDSLVGLASAGMVSDSFVLVIEPSTRAFGNKPDVLAMTKTEAETEEALRELYSRVIAGLATVLFFPASKLVVDTFWEETIEYERSFFFGRSKENDLVLDVLGVSGNHGQVVCDGRGEWSIVDLSSTNGTMLNGVTVRGAARLKPGDVVMVAHRELFRVREILSKTIGDFAPDEINRVNHGTCFESDAVAPGADGTHLGDMVGVEGHEDESDSTDTMSYEYAAARTVEMTRGRDVRRR